MSIVKKYIVVPLVSTPPEDAPYCHPIICEVGKAVAVRGWFKMAKAPSLVLTRVRTVVPKVCCK